MSAISHSIDKFKLLNLGYLRNGKGPYAIRQDGYSPDSTTMDEHRFILMEDGSWLRNHAFFLLPEEEQEKCLFGSLNEVFRAIDSLAGKEVVVDDNLPKGTTKEQVISGIRAAGNRVAQRINEAKAGSLKR